MDQMSIQKAVRLTRTTVEETLCDDAGLRYGINRTKEEQKTSWERDKLHFHQSNKRRKRHLAKKNLCKNKTKQNLKRDLCQNRNLSAVVHTYNSSTQKKTEAEGLQS